MCQITLAVWMSLSLLKTSNHNQDIISSTGSKNNRFIDMHKESKYPIYNEGDLDKIVKIEIHEETEKYILRGKERELRKQN